MGVAVLGRRRRVVGEVMEASPFCLCCFQLSGHHCSSQDEFGFEVASVEKALVKPH